MLLLNDAFRALAHNFSTLIVALVSVFLISAGYFSAIQAANFAAFPETQSEQIEPDAAVQAEKPENEKLSAAVGEDVLPPKPIWLIWTDIAAEIAFATAISILYAVLFARLGRNIDRPLWKCESDREALRRFFVPWFILTLSTMALRDFQFSLGSVDVQFALEFVLMTGGIFLVPIGACIMHRGALVWEELGETLAIIPRQIRLFAPVVFVGLFQYILQVATAISLPEERGHEYAVAWLSSIGNVPQVFIDLLVFCMVWRICMLDRDAGPASATDLFDD